jgi:hypothetical protein
MVYVVRRRLPRLQPRRPLGPIGVEHRLTRTTRRRPGKGRGRIATSRCALSPLPTEEHQFISKSYPRATWRKTRLTAPLLRMKRNSASCSWFRIRSSLCLNLEPIDYKGLQVVNGRAVPPKGAKHYQADHRHTPAIRVKPASEGYTARQENDVREAYLLRKYPQLEDEPKAVNDSLRCSPAIKCRPPVTQVWKAALGPPADDD